ncbi:putative mediated genome instability protein rmi1 [Diaporthe ampelina]|uniref:Putative mediated genome instability protein rmi1 n=1 Tax=Diaporthe ampelina TaxID=1214573 RepID=A0A0G2H8F0_9PEZI|nr:putative mediated genome instability protein rmi1 [Diaporthe ampelina]
MSLSAQIYTQLQNLNLPQPSQPWLQALISARDPPPPLPSLVMTAKTRLLASDLTTPGLLDPESVPAISLPSTISDPAIKETRLGHHVYVQVADIEDLAKSRWEHVEELEAIERGEQTRGREIIHLPTNAAEAEDVQNGTADGPEAQAAGAMAGAGVSGPATAAYRKATHRLVLQDCKGQMVYGLELTRIPRIAIGTLNIGEKILLQKGAVVARGAVLLEPATCHILGGRVDAW